MTISVIIANRNGQRWLERCLRAVVASTSGRDAEVVLVDNASSDQSVELVRDRFPSVRVLTQPSNAGFAGGSNAGARAASGTWLAFLNNDTEVEPDWLDRLVEAASSRPDVGAVTSRIVYMDDPRIIDSAGDGYLRAGGAFKRGHGDERARWGDGGEVFGACGAACMIRRDLFETLGGFDEAFFMTFEDVDLSYGIQLAGERCVYAPRAIVRHAGSASLGRLSQQAIFLGQRNIEWVYWKNTPWPLLLRSLPSHALYELAAAVHFARAGALGTFLRAKWAALVGVAGLLPKRRARQRLRRVSCRELWRRMEPGWLGIKLKEKPFDLVAARK